MAGEGVRLLSADALNQVEGTSTGKPKEHFDAIVAGVGQFYLSGMSAKARGFNDRLIEGRPAQFAMPDKLVGLLFEADRSLTY